MERMIPMATRYSMTPPCERCSLKFVILRKNEGLLLSVVSTSSDATHRSDAADALAYARQSKWQIEALVQASFDADGDVRNSAIRALGVLLKAKPELGRYVPAERFISLLSSARWEDRNKASFVLLTMTKQETRN